MELDGSCIYQLALCYSIFRILVSERRVHKKDKLHEPCIFFFLMNNYASDSSGSVKDALDYVMGIQALLVQ